MNKQELELILRFVEKKLAHGKRKSWKNKDFEKLSFIIHRQTKVLISVATLKRLFGKVKTDRSYTPQPATIEALKLFCDFDKLYTKQQTNRYRQLKIMTWSMVTLVILAIVYLIIINPNPMLEDEVNVTAALNITRVEGKCPATAFFDILTDNPAASLEINFGDGTMRIPTKKKRSISHFYAYPGLFNVGIYDKNKRISNEEAVLVETDRWQGIAHYHGEPVERYYPLLFEDIFHDEVVHAEPMALAKAGLDTTKVLVVRIDNYRATTFSGDSFELNARVKNGTFWPGIRCYSVILMVQGTYGKVSIKLVEEGCSGYSELIAGEIRQFGTEEISALSVSLKDWLDVKIVNRDKNIIIALDGKKVLSSSYQKSIGDIVGGSVIFHGSGTLDMFELQSQGNEIVSL